MAIKINIFPDTGCHVHFTPIASISTGSPPDEIAKEIQKGLESLGNLSSEFVEVIKEKSVEDASEWHELQGKPWMRYRFGARTVTVPGPIKDKEVQLAGIWIAIESNLGDRTRGFKTLDQPPTPHENEEYIKSRGQPLPCPYRTASVTELSEPFDTHKIEIAIISEGKHSEKTLLKAEIEISIAWKRSGIVLPIEVDLVIDFGNTRTAAVALERHPGAKHVNPNEFSVQCRKILLYPSRFDRALVKRDEKKNCSDSIVDSWFILKEPVFSEFEGDIAEPFFSEKEEGSFFSKRRVPCCVRIVKRIPQFFAQLSPAILGVDAYREIQTRYTRALLEKGGFAMQSSPKRYYWDEKSGNTHWNMTLRPYSKKRIDDPEQRQSIPKLECPVLRLMPLNAERWVLDNPPTLWTGSRKPKHNPEHPIYPRCCTLTWTLLSIIEAAWNQLNSAEGLEGTGEFKPRHLSSVTATFPSGWSPKEVEAYKYRWEEAINIFHLANSPVGGKPPEMDMNIDEAVASQLPFIFSEVIRMGNNGENWLKLVGRSDGKLRAINLDIGGGTTDVAIIEFEDTQEGPSVTLNAKLLFKHSFSLAGDAIVRRLIEDILLPMLAEGRDIDQNKYREYFSSALNTGEKMKRAFITRRVLIPIATRWLEAMAQGGAIVNAEGKHFSPADVGIEKQEWECFLNQTGLPDIPVEDTIPVQPRWIQRIVDELFDPIIRSLARYAAAFDTDILLLSGKPTELSQIRTLIEKRMPFSKNRIVSAKGYMAGAWYPFRVNDAISDAKSVTVVGAALARALSRGVIAGWTLDMRVGEFGVKGNLWGILDPGPRARNISVKLLDTNAKISTATQMQTGCVIGKAHPSLSTFPEPVYRLMWKDANRDQATLTGIMLARESDEKGEWLTIAPVSNVKDHRDNKVSTDDLQLVLCPTWDNEDFWMDSGKLDTINFDFIHS